MALAGLATLLATAGCGAPAADRTSSAADRLVAEPSRHLVAAPAPEPVVDTVETTASYRDVLPSVGELFATPKVDLVVQGRVTAIEFRLLDQLVPMTVMTVAVSRSRGDAGESVTVWESGGYIPVSAHSKDDQAKFAQNGDAEAGGVVDYRGSSQLRV